MFKLLLLFTLLATSCYASKVHMDIATTADKPCDYSSGHGFIFFSPNYDTACDTFIIYHLGELECPHQYIVTAEVTVQQSLKSLYCNKMAQENDTVYVVAPEFVLPQFMSGQITSFSTQFFQGFFYSVLEDSVTIKVMNMLYAQMINIMQTEYLSYFLYQDSAGNHFMSHIITTAPDFDHLVVVHIETGSPSGSTVGRKVRIRSPPVVKKCCMGPVLVKFDLPNNYWSRLKEGEKTYGHLYEVQNQQMTSRDIYVIVKKNIYPGPYKENGDGQTDFQQFCVDPDKPVWDSCRVFGSKV